MQTTVYLCEESLEGIFSAIYRAWSDGTSHTDVRIRSTSSMNTMSLFESYIDTEADPELADKVVSSIQKKLSDEVYYYVFRTALSFDPDRASVIYHFLQKAFRIGNAIVKQLQDPDMMRVFELTRQIGNESHKYLGFVRFEEMNHGILVSKINPKSNVVPLIASHFADRLHNENWIILDTGRDFSAIHTANKGYYLTTNLTEATLSEVYHISDHEEQYQQLWSQFFHSVAIAERKNTDLQRNMMPLRYRTYMNVENP